MDETQGVETTVSAAEDLRPKRRRPAHYRRRTFDEVRAEERGRVADMLVEVAERVRAGSTGVLGLSA